MSQLEKLLAVNKKEGSKAALEFYQSFTDEEKELCRAEIASVMEALRDTWQVFQDAILQAAGAITEWWNKIPAETRESFAKKVDNDYGPHEPV
jgi:hypothetical protein